MATPSFRRSQTYNVDAAKYRPSGESVDVYRELNAIAEEIEACRERNRVTQGRVAPERAKYAI